MTEILRRATLDEEAIAPLVTESEAQGFTFVRALVDDWRAGTNRFDRPGEAFFVARRDGSVVGVCGLNIDPYDDDGETGRVRHLYVAEPARRHGVGRLLVAAVEDAAKDVFTRLRLRTRNPEAARFYEASGYTAVNEPACTHLRNLIRDT